MTRSEQWQIMARVLAAVTPLGALIGLIPGYFLGDGTTRSIVTGALIGFLIAAGMVAFDVGWAVGLIPRGWREAPFLVVLVTRSLAWLAIIVTTIAVPLLTIGGVAWNELVDPGLAWSVVISFVAALVINFIAQVNRLLGRGVLVGLILGRYHRPREEVRIFLFVDLRSSTQIAEKLGNLRYHAFLKRFVADVSTSALRHGADIHRFVGDEVVLTWTERKGLENAACIQTVFAMADAIDHSSGDYLAEFGAVPSFWAGLHMGPVVTGEIGTVKHEIVYLGDTPNTTARIEQACRDFERTFLASGDVVEAVTIPDGITVESLGPIDLRGVGNSVELFALDR
ncbi:MAG: adenylate/guanylate cyclase domain-containing protein [Acidimicrobiia bacterium]|nr:adenylate/guanylate cyclase domain-containing protein [Acidimicrobiia bacterium]